MTRRSPTPARARARATTAGWRQVRASRRGLGDSLAQRPHLRLHGWCLGSLTLAVMGAASHLLMHLGVHALALRYLLTLAVGYLAYLLALRLWAGWLVRRQARAQDDGGWLQADWPGGGGGGGGGSGSGGAAPWRGGGGGDYAGAGASGSWDAPAPDGAAAEGLLGDVAGGALEAAASADEGAVVVVPVVAIFLLGAALLGGAGALAWLYFGSEVLLAVAVELAFSVAAARAAMGVQRAGWLGAAVRLTWKPLLAAVLCAALLGAAVQYAVPQAQSLPQAVQLLRGR